ncbi:hypothetical protein [Actinomadura madurae]|uniref:hypothetical protein n=1 Tax=Actinomadura madurae TaxID=1993 RepID=UPI0020D24DDA|nr:hypothetical protein [Actinomadura madurae]MCQ0009593.1 hypothetical protein [Actinomadura madurae]
MTQASAGSEYARTRDIIAVFAVLLALTAVLVVVLVQAWPAARGRAPAGAAGSPRPRRPSTCPDGRPPCRGRRACS